MPALRRRDFITLMGGAAAAWPLAARAQQPAMPVVGFVNIRSPEPSGRNATAFRKALNETGYVEGQNVMVEYHWLEGRYDRLPSLMADLVRRRVAVIATPGQTAVAQAAKAATTTIPIVFGVGDDPVRLGLVASLAQPGGNATGINFFTREVAAKRLGLFHDLVPKAARIAMLVNPGNHPIAELILRDIPEAARALGLQMQVLNASTSREIEAAFATIARDRADALFVAPDAFFNSRRVQLATLAARDRTPTSCSGREMAEAGLLMSYGTDTRDMYHQVGTYTGQILNGVKPADLPVLQSTKFELVINLQTARALGSVRPLRRSPRRTATSSLPSSTMLRYLAPIPSPTVRASRPCSTGSPATACRSFWSRAPIGLHATAVCRLQGTTICARSGSSWCRQSAPDFFHDRHDRSPGAAGARGRQPV
jgi:putative ABC transport system substrate-binding protein